MPGKFETRETATRIDFKASWEPLRELSEQIGAWPSEIVRRAVWYALAHWDEVQKFYRANPMPKNKGS